MKWLDAEDIGIALYEKFPAIDPLTVRFTDLRQKVLTRIREVHVTLTETQTTFEPGTIRPPGA